MKYLMLLTLLWFGLNVSAQHRPENKKSADTKEAQVKKQQAEQDVQKGRAEKKQKMEDAKRIAKEKVARDTSKTATPSK